MGTAGGSAAARILYATRPAGGDWDAPQPVTPLTSWFGEPSLAIDPSGRMTVAYVTGGPPSDIGARTRAPGGAWIDQGLVSALPAGAEGGTPTVAMDDAGQPVVAWLANATPDLAQLRALDTQGPLSAGLSIPAAATVGQPASFAWPAIDAWSAVTSVAWTFGDGASGSGSSVTKTYGAPGTVPGLGHGHRRRRQRDDPDGVGGGHRRARWWSWSPSRS